MTFEVEIKNKHNFLLLSFLFNLSFLLQHFKVHCFLKNFIIFQRIISPQRESTPPIMMLNYNSKQQQQQQQQLQHSQQLNSQTLPRQSPTTTADNNAEDTSNDVSEIGTISDLTTPEAISTANNNLLVTGVNVLNEHTTPPTPPPMDKDIDDIVVMERGAATTASSLTSCTTPTTTAAIAAVVAAATANTSSTTATTAQAAPPAAATTTMTPLNVNNALSSSTVPSMMSMTMNSSNPLSIPTKSSTFDYLYEFSETRKVLEEFFKCPSNDDKPIIENSSDVDSIVSFSFILNNILKQKTC